MPIPRLPDADLRALARRIHAGEVFIVSDKEGVEASFGGMLSLSDWLASTSEADIKEMGAFYEDVSKAGPRTINGHPVFFSFNVLHIEDLAILREYYKKLREVVDHAFDDSRKEQP